MGPYLFSDDNELLAYLLLLLLLLSWCDAIFVFSSLIVDIGGIVDEFERCFICCCD